MKQWRSLSIPTSHGFARVQNIVAMEKIIGAMQFHGTIEKHAQLEVELCFTRLLGKGCNSAEECVLCN